MGRVRPSVDAGLPAELIEAAEDESVDADVRDSHTANSKRVDAVNGSPVLSSVLAPKDADRVFNGLRLLSGVVGSAR